MLFSVHQVTKCYFSYNNFVNVLKNVRFLKMQHINKHIYLCFKLCMLVLDSGL
jgi:hypothetical protein